MDEKMRINLTNEGAYNLLTNTFLVEEDSFQHLKLDYSPFCACAGFVYIFWFGLDPLQLYNMKYNGYALNKLMKGSCSSEVNFF